MKYYARGNTGISSEELGEILNEAGFSVSSIILDTEVQQKQAGSRYSLMKEVLALTKEPLILNSIFSLGKNAREVTKELEWFMRNGIEVYVLDMPSTLEKDVCRVAIMHDVNAKYAAREIEKLKEGQKRSAEAAKEAGIRRKTSPGRPKIPYPPNWTEEYDKWKAHETTSAEFMAAVKLSQGTFYNLLRHYKEDLLQQEKEREQGQESGQRRA